VPDTFAELRHELAVANRILGHEGVIDAFGHVSIRHPGNAGRYFLSRSRAPALVEPDDILEFTLDSEPVQPPTAQLYAERVIHGEIYKARPDVLAVCHHHSAAIMPFCISGDPVVPVFHLGAAMGPVAGTAATISATPISWWSSRRKAHRSPARSEIIPWC